MNKNDVIKLAQNELGYLEKSQQNYSLYGVNCLYYKEGYAGKDNLTKYAYETGHQNGQPWCQTFIAWLFLNCYGRDVADRLLADKIESASTMEVKDAMVSKGWLVPLAKAEPGDIVFRSRNGGGHVGLVEGRDSYGRIITIEGNSSSADISSWNGGAVVRHIGASWEWCCRPDWSILPKDESWNWNEVGGIWYYQNDAGENMHGWALIKETQGIFLHWYYFNTQGQMLVGHHWIDNKLCLFMPSGALQGALCVSDDEGCQSPMYLTETD